MVEGTEVKLRCGVYGEGTVFPVKIARDAEVSALQKAIVDEKKDVNDRFKVDPAALTLYLARKKGRTTWMKHESNTESFLQGGVDTDYDKMLSSWALDDEEYFGPNFQPGRKEIHVLVELPDAAVGDGKANEPPNKKQRLERNRISFTGPLHRDECAVPFATIDAFRQIKEGFSRKEAIGLPLFLLYGPRQFGKTTIAYRIMDWIASDSKVADVKCVFFEMHVSDAADEQTFWKRLGQCIHKESACCDYESFRRLMVECTGHDRTQLCLIVDEMDCLFSNKELAATFLNVLRKWKVAPYFRGFLGIGSHELIHHHEIFRGDHKTSPLTLVS